MADHHVSIPASGPTSHSYISQRIRLNYLDWGNESAPPLVLLHGGRDHARSWDWVASQLRQDWHVIAPDLRGHGDSSWTSDGNYPMLSFVYDLAQLIHQLDLAPVTLVAHSLGGNIALRYTGLFPDKVRKLVAIEGLGPSPEMMEKRRKTGQAEFMRRWIDETRKASARQPRRYASFADALARMKEANSHLSDEQVRHLTLYGVNRNEDGSYSWKFDPYINIWPVVDIAPDEMQKLWRAITCPTLLCYGDDSWASNPEQDGRISHFGDNARVISYANAGHWLHHDQFEQFLSDIREFL